MYVFSFFSDITWDIYFRHLNGLNIKHNNNINVMMIDLCKGSGEILCDYDNIFHSLTVFSTLVLVPQLIFYRLRHLLSHISFLSLWSDRHLQWLSHMSHILYFGVSATSSADTAVFPLSFVAHSVSSSLKCASGGCDTAGPKDGGPTYREDND